MVFKVELRVEKNAKVLNCGDVIGTRNLLNLLKIFAGSFWLLLLLLIKIDTAGETLALEMIINFVLSGWRESLCNLK
jgi:hypothetical protein